jgi:hypothetical protein
VNEDFSSADLEMLKNRLEKLEAQNDRQDTMIQATEQAIAAMRKAEVAAAISKENTTFLNALNRRLNSLICIVSGMGLVYFGRETWVDATMVNDDIGKALLFVGCGFVGYGLLVSNGNEQWVVSLLRRWIDRH